MLTVLLFILVVCISILIASLLRRNQVLEKLMYLNLIMNLSSLLIITMGSNYYTRYLVDISIIYLLLSFIGNSAYFKFYVSTPEQPDNESN